MSSSLPSAVMVADDVIDLLRVAVENIRHMQALLGAIKNDHKHGNHVNTEQLADLGAFLGYDWGNYHENQISRAESELAASERDVQRPKQDQRSEGADRFGIPLESYAAGRHAALAVQLGMTQWALSKAIRNNRAIYITEHTDGTLSAVEHKAFGTTGFSLKGGAQ